MGTDVISHITPHQVFLRNEEINKFIIFTFIPVVATENQRYCSAPALHVRLFLWAVKMLYPTTALPPSTARLSTYW
jgi:hypothetical protein